MKDFSKDLISFGYDVSGKWHRAKTSIPHFKSFAVAIPACLSFWLFVFWLAYKFSEFLKH